MINNPESFEDTGRVFIEDKKFIKDCHDKNFINIQFIRIVAKEIKFKNVNFSYSTFDAAYMRDCVFDSCKFIGCCFANSNLSGSSFSGCQFNYATFEKTLIDDDILQNSCPTEENLKLKFARSLRLNYQHLGNASAANKAIGIELKATENHLYKAWQSKEAYYRKKYQRWQRVKVFFAWVKFKSLDFMWGNGESLIKLFRAVGFSLICIAIIHVVLTGNPNYVGEYIKALLLSPKIFLGIVKLDNYPTSILMIILLLRLILFGFFMSITIKRLNRR